MERRGDETVASETEASAGSKEGVVRWVLGISLLLICVLFTIIWVTGALSQKNGGDTQESVSREIQYQQSQSDNQQGEPVPPTFGGAQTHASGAQPAASATPGDAPAGDPKPDTM